VNNRTKDIDRLCEIAVRDLFRSEADVIIPYFLKGVTVEGPLSAEEKSIGRESQVEERTRQVEIESILNAVRSCFSAIVVEFAKRLGRIQNIEVLEEIEKAALASDIQRVLSLVRENDPTE
jgi:hypothetical protein